MAEFSLLEGTMRCPTCRAVQEWSDVCRRCRCDLRLLRQAADEYQEARRHCLAALHAGRPDEAAEWAERCVEIEPDAAARRLLAACLFAHGDWSGACSVAATLESEFGT